MEKKVSLCSHTVERQHHSVSFAWVWGPVVAWASSRLCQGSLLCGWGTQLESVAVQGMSFSSCSVSSAHSWHMSSCSFSCACKYIFEGRILDSTLHELSGPPFVVPPPFDFKELHPPVVSCPNVRPAFCCCLWNASHPDHKPFGIR